MSLLEDPDREWAGRVVQLPLRIGVVECFVFSQSPDLFKREARPPGEFAVQADDTDRERSERGSTGVVFPARHSPAQ